MVPVREGDVFFGCLWSVGLKRRFKVRAGMEARIIEKISHLFCIELS